MKKYVLSTLMCLAGYAGAFASNEVVESKVSEELELNNYVDSIDSTLSDNNCWGQFKMKKGDGEAEVFGYATNASSEDNCNEKMKKFRSIMESAGYELVESPSIIYT